MKPESGFGDRKPKTVDRKSSCSCPYCEHPLPEGGTVCAPCGVNIMYCDECGKPLPAGAVECPDCNPISKKGSKK